MPCEQHDDGLYQKYEVRRMDGKPVGRVFVLNPESDPAAYQALITYAAFTSNMTLRADLTTWIHALRGEQ